MARATRPISDSIDPRVLTQSENHTISQVAGQPQHEIPLHSDKENAVSRSKRSMADTDAATASRAKRRRTDNGTMGAHSRRSSSDPVEMDSGVGGISQSQSQVKSVRFYDPEQNETERRRLKIRGRNLEREIRDNRDQYIQQGSTGIKEAIQKANSIFKNVKQTSEATLDGRTLVTLSDLAHKKASMLVLGDNANGIDIDDFVSKCISYMRQTIDRPASSRRRRATQNDDDDDDDDAEQVLDWATLGSKICIPHNLRPAVTGFLLGPLSVQKKARAATQRRPRLNTQRGDETRPEDLTANDMQRSTDNSVRTVCANIKTRLVNHCAQAAEAVEASVDDTATEEQIAQAMRGQRITSTGGPGLFDFVINPDDFGQTVENLFYVSFLIKEGEVGIEEDSNGLPTLSPNQETVQGARERKATRHQAVFGLDYKTWKDLVNAFDINEPLIPNRAAEASRAQVGRHGWYA